MTLADFFAGIREGRAAVQRCRGCGALAVPPRAACTECHGQAWGEQALSGEGAVASYTVIRVPPGSLAGEAPYTIVVARMAEGVALLGRLAGPTEAARVGLPVRLVPSLAPPGGPPVVTFAARREEP